jgi:hypothetical protein
VNHAGFFFQYPGMTARKVAAYAMSEKKEPTTKHMVQ